MGEPRRDSSDSSVDDYPSYAGTPLSYTAVVADGLLLPRRPASSLILRGIANYAARSKTSASDYHEQTIRLSDADKLAERGNSFYEETRRSSCNASPGHLPLAIAGPFQIPEGDLYMDREAAEAYAGANQQNFDDDGDLKDSESAVKHPRVSPSTPERISITFINLKCKAGVIDGTKWRGKAAVEKEILHGVTGWVNPGELLATMGPSGSGKTTLLNLLGGRLHPTYEISGSILYNDQPYEKHLKRRMGFVTQDDVLYPHLTVSETLTFTALLRLPRELSRDQKVARAENVMAQLGLQSCQDTIIGGRFLRGVSGGERKRVCIGQEILLDPSLILLDEPTSGLDSTTALRIIRLLQYIAREGRTIVITIHQPSSRAFHVFDKLILLSEGNCVYFGKARDAMMYFDSIGFKPLIPMNPADFLLDLCSGNTSDMSVPAVLCKHLEKKKQRIDDQADPNHMQIAPSTVIAKDVKKYLKNCSQQRSSSMEKTRETGLREIQSTGKILGTEKWTRGATWWDQFTILFVRGMKERRHEYLSWTRIIQVVFSASLGGCLWWQSKHSTPEELEDQVGLLFFIGVFWGYFPLFTSIFTFPLERPMLAKERASGMYSLSAYFMARTLSDLPLELMLPLLFMGILYFMASLQHTILAITFTTLTVCLDVIVSQGVGFFIGAALMDVQRASTFAAVFVLGFMLAGGYFLQYIPPFIKWIQYISFQSHTYKILLEVQYKHVDDYNCSTGGGRRSCQSIDTAQAFGRTTLHGGWKSVLALVAMVFGYRIMAYLALRRMKI